EQRAYRGGIADVGRHDKRVRARRLAQVGSSLQRVPASPGQHHRIAFFHESDSRLPADAAARAGDHGDLSERIHVTNILPVPEFFVHLPSTYYGGAKPTISAKTPASK